MALPILDGNQTATTLSSVVTGGEHIVAHTVVSLGSTAIANITSAVSGVSISGTVTANGGNFAFAENEDTSVPSARGVLIGWRNDSTGEFKNASDAGPLPISGTVTVGNSVTIASLPVISGTVTANNPSGALTTRFGSVTTANTAQITSAVTNTSRKYLLAQNISAGTVTIGIGFSPTTTQGIQLTAGGGLTFDAFCPTGAVYWLGAVTGAAWTILEG